MAPENTPLEKIRTIYDEDNEELLDEPECDCEVDEFDPDGHEYDCGFDLESFLLAQSEPADQLIEIDNYGDGAGFCFPSDLSRVYTNRQNMREIQVGLRERRLIKILKSGKRLELEQR